MYCLLCTGHRCSQLIYCLLFTVLKTVNSTKITVKKKKQYYRSSLLKIDDIFKFVLVPGALDEYNDDDEDFRDDEEED